MADSSMRAAWGRVGDELSGLGLKLKYHVEQERDDDREVTSALARLRESVDDIVDAIESAAEDEAVREDLRETRRLLMEALTATVTIAKSEVAKLSNRPPK